MIAFSRSLQRALCAALGLLALASCSSIPAGPGGAITKVKTYSLDPTQRMRPGMDPSIRFERSHRLYGAVTMQQQLDRAGQYFTLLWKANDRSQPVTVRFDYRQQATGNTVHSLEQIVSDVRGSNVSEFQVTGSAFQTNGRVTAWRASLMRGKEVLAIAESFLWK